MIEIIKGNRKVSKWENIISKHDQTSNNNNWDCMLTEECWILEIPLDANELDLYNAHQNNTFFIPHITEELDNRYDVFWNSNETYVFGSFDEAVEFIDDYQGIYQEEVNGLNMELAEFFLVEETKFQFSDVEQLDKEFDVDFMNELEDLIASQSISMNSVLASMKLVMLSKYRQRVQEQRLSRLN